MIKAEQQFHTHPKQGPPRHDLRKPRVLDDPMLDEKDEDLEMPKVGEVEDVQYATFDDLEALVDDEFNELTDREIDKRDIILDDLEVSDPIQEELLSGKSK